MLLVIDAGNTNIVFALYDGKDKRGSWRIATDAQRTADQYAVWLNSVMALKGLKAGAISCAIIGSVVPDATFNLQRLCIDHLEATPLIIGRDKLDYGIDIHMDRPEEVGADRILNAVAAFERYGGPAIVIDFGTATTFDIVGADGSYSGGIIAPAAGHSLDALHRIAAKLPRVDIAKPESVIGKSTVSGMQSGIYWGYVSLIEGLVKRIQLEYGATMRVIATGGLAPMFAGSTDAIDDVDPDLTLRGLVLVYQRNAHLCAA